MKMKESKSKKNNERPEDMHICSECKISEISECKSSRLRNWDGYATWYSFYIKLEDILINKIKKR